MYPLDLGNEGSLLIYSMIPDPEEEYPMPFSLNLGKLGSFLKWNEMAEKQVIGIDNQNETS